MNIPSFLRDLGVDEQQYKKLQRLNRCLDILVIKRYDHYEAINKINNHRYKLTVRSKHNISCTCKDHQKGNICKHIFALKRDFDFFNPSYSS